MDNRSQVILNAQMKFLFRGGNPYVMQRHITQGDICSIRKIDIELINTHFAAFDESTKARALRTISALEKELNMCRVTFHKHLRMAKYWMHGYLGAEQKSTIDKFENRIQ